MKGQWGLILGLVAALIIAIFAVVNVESVAVNYVFGSAESPLILVILGSVLMGSIIAGGLSIVRIYQLQGEIKKLKKEASLHAHEETQVEQAFNSEEEAVLSPSNDTAEK